MRFRLILVVLCSYLPITVICQKNGLFESKPNCTIVFFREAEAEHVVYLKQRGIGKIDSTITLNGIAYFYIPYREFDAYSINIKDKPLYFEWIFPDSSGSNILIEIYDFDRLRTFVDAGVRQDQWQEGLVELYQRFTTYMGEKDSPGFQGELDELRRRHENAIFEIFKFHFILDETVGYSLIANFINSLRSIDASPELVSKLLELIRNPSQEEFIKDPYVQDIYSQLDRLNETKVGLKYLAFSIIGSELDTIHTLDYTGKYMLLDFWASWCSPCIKKNNEILLNINEFEERDIQIIGVFIDHWRQRYKQELVYESQEYLTMFPWEQGLLFANITTESIFDFYQFYAVPRTFLISPEGIILAINPVSVEDVLTIVDNSKN